MNPSLKPAEHRRSDLPKKSTGILSAYLTERSRQSIAALALAMLLMVCVVGWFQYAQIDRIALASAQGKDNVVWAFYKLEVLVMDYQLALREVLAQPGNPALLHDLYSSYNVFASHIQTVDQTSTGQIMGEYGSYQTAMPMVRDYMASADVFLELEPVQLPVTVAQSLLVRSLALRTALHKVVLDAYQIENFRSTQSLTEMRRFTVLYGVSSFFLVVLALATGALTLRRFVLNDRLQLERAERLREKKESAEAANKAKARFLSSASHDLRQPAHALGLFMERIKQVSVDPLSLSLVAQAMAAVREMQDMLDSMFDMSRLDSETAQTTLRAFAVNDVFDSVRYLLENDALAKGLRLRIRASSAWLQSDSALLQRIVLNLVSNAIRYTERGTVLLVCRPTAGGTHARIEIWDSGIGIAPEHQEKVFQEFYQVGNPQRDRRLGLGVGLNVVDRSCRLLEHPLSLRSCLGAGTRVALVVPIAKPKPEAEPRFGIPTPAHETFTAAHVLLIEDDAMGRTALTGLLESWGYAVTAVEGATLAVEQFQKAPHIDLIISDFRLGGGSNGMDAIQMLRTLAGRKLVACLISGDTSLEFRQQVKDAGLLLLSKPVRPGKLRSLLRHIALKDAGAVAAF